MIIRKADLKDVTDTVDLWKEFMKYHDEIIIKKNKKVKPYLTKKKNAADIFRKYVQKIILSKDSITHVAEVEGRLAGYSLNCINNNIPVFKIKKIGYMSDLFVKKEFRGLGISTKLKNEAIKWFKKKGIKYVSIKVHNDNELAHSIYKKWGFFDFHTEMRKKI
jgi:GNAT superfamily N-acetyltransferase